MHLITAITTAITAIFGGLFTVSQPAAAATPALHQPVQAISIDPPAAMHETPAVTTIERRPTYITVTHTVPQTEGAAPLSLVQALAAQVGTLTEIIGHTASYRVPQQVAGNGLQGGYQAALVAASAPVTIVNQANTVPASGVTGTLTNAIESALATISSLAGNDLSYTRGVFNEATTTTLSVTGHASLASAAVTGSASVAATTTTRDLRITSLDCSSYGNGGKLTTDQFGSVVCATDQGGSGGTVAGANTQIQFNDAGGFGASPSFTFSNTANRLSVTNASTTALSTAYASSTNLVAGSATVSSLNNTLVYANQYGQLISVATSSIGLPTFADLSSALGNYFSLSSWFSTTTASHLTTLANLSTVGTITSGTWSGSFGAVSGANLTNLTAANIAAGTAGISISGNANTATTLQTARTINGVSFNGSSNITLTAASSTLLADSNTFTGNTTLANATTTNLALTSVTSALHLGNAQGSVVPYTGTSCTNQFVRSVNGSGVATCASVNLASDVTGTLAIANGGTGTSTQVTNGIAYFDGTKITTGTGLIYTGGNVGIGATPTSMLYVGGSKNITSSTESSLGIFTTLNTTAATAYLTRIEPTIASSSASAPFITGMRVAPTIKSGLIPNIPNYYNVNSQPIIDTTYSGTISNLYDYVASSPTIGSGASPITNFSGFALSAITNGNGVTSGTVSNRGFYALAMTASSSAGGTVNNYGFFGNTPVGSPSGGTTSNYAFYLTGNGGTSSGGTVKNFSLYNASLASSYFAGAIGVGTTSPAYDLDVAGTIRGTLYDNGGAVYNVRAFGAKGDGVTDDSAAIQSAIETAAGATVYIPEGTYIVKGLIIPHYASERRTRIACAGRTNSVLKLPDNANTFILATYSYTSNTTWGDYGVIVDSCGFDGNKANQTATSSLVYLRSWRSVVTNSQIDNSAGHGIEITTKSSNGTSLASGGTSGNKIENTFFDYNDGSAIFGSDLVNRLSDNFVYDNEFAFNGADGYYHVQVETGPGWEVSGNRFYGCPSGALGLIYLNKTGSNKIGLNDIDNTGCAPTDSGGNPTASVKVRLGGWGNLVVQGNTFHDRSTTTSSTRRHLYIQNVSAVAPSVSVTGNSFNFDTTISNEAVYVTGFSSTVGQLCISGNSHDTNTTWNSTIGSCAPLPLLATQLGIGVTTTSAQLHTTGTVRFANFGAGTLQTDASGNLTVSSDERLKEVRGTFTRGLTDLLRISPIEYHWNQTSGLDHSTLYAGFSAQNVQTAIPEAVGTSSGGYLSLQDRPIIAALVNAVKEVATFTGAFRTGLVSFLSDEGNGLSVLFAHTARFVRTETGELVASDRICIGPSETQTCVTQAQLAALLTASGQVIQNAPAVSTAPQIQPTNTENPAETSTTTSTTTPVSTETTPTTTPTASETETTPPASPPLE